MPNNVSFGRAIRVYAPIKVAHKIAKSANSSIPLSGLNSFAKTIFNDTDIAKAKVVAVDSDEIYIFSGEEAKQQAKIFKDLKEKINKNNELISSCTDEIIDEKRKHQAIKEKCKDVYCAIFEMKKITENGKGGYPKSRIAVQSKTVKKPIFGDCEVIDRATYTSRRRSKVERLEYKS